MTRKITSILFLSVILFTSTIAASVTLMQDAEAYKSSGNYVRKFGSSIVCGDKLCSDYKGGRAAYEKLRESAGIELIKKMQGIEKPETKGFKKFSSESEILKKQLENILEKIQLGQAVSTGEFNTLRKALMEIISTETIQERYDGISRDTKGETSLEEHAFGLTKSYTVTSLQHLVKGHEGQHQIAEILPPTDNVYVGKITFSASEPVQLVTLHGPIGLNDDGGQPIWSSDDNTTFAITFVDNDLRSGGWYFAGNALGLHSFNPDGFTATYTLAGLH